MRHGFRIATLGALAASLGDMGELWAGNAQRPRLGLSPPPSGLLELSIALGVIGITLYAVGYFAWADQWRRAGRARSSTALFWLGLLTAGAGAAVHALTGVLISLPNAAGSDAADPLSGILQTGPAALTLWGLGLGLFALTGLLIAVAELSRRLKLLSPLPVMVGIGLAAQALPHPARDFVQPAAFNLAHLASFGWLALSSRPQAR